MTVIELLLILLAVGGGVLYLRQGRKHVHKWRYMFSGGESNTYNWFYCTECLTQCVAKINNTGMIELQYYEVKKPWRPKK